MRTCTRIHLFRLTAKSFFFFVFCQRILTRKQTEEKEKKMSQRNSSSNDSDEKSSSDSMDITVAAKTADSSHKYGFWQNLINKRESLLKDSNIEIAPMGSAGNEKSKHSEQNKMMKKVVPDDDDGDCISELIGHKGLWQLTWSFILIVFQVPSAFHIFSFVFQVSDKFLVQNQVNALGS